jgi:hypothetical protein
MDSRRLSARAKQPGHDRTFRKSEEKFYTVATEILSAGDFMVRDHPRDLADLLGGTYGIVPEASIEYRPTGRKMYFEVKKQGARGNADERACKHHTVRFYRVLQERTGYDYHAFCTILCEALAAHPRYTTKHPYFFEPDHYFLWVDYDRDLLRQFLEHIAEKHLKR